MCMKPKEKHLNKKIIICDSITGNALGYGYKLREEKQK